jgi:hypothetical protein
MQAMGNDKIEAKNKLRDSVTSQVRMWGEGDADAILPDEVRKYKDELIDGRKEEYKLMG